MKTIVLVSALVAGVALVSAPADAAPKRKAGTPVPVGVTDPYIVRAYDGDVLGRDPDPFIRLMLIREGKPQDHSGR